MFDSVQVDSETLRSCADGLHDSVRELRLAAARRLARVAHWADLHSPTPGHVGVVLGGHGCPEVTPFTATELGCLLQTTTHSARALLADALDLRHRHPQCWEAVMTGQVEDFKARHLARATRTAELSLHQARQVDSECVEALVGLPWGRAMSVTEAAIIRADPAGHERRRAEAEQQRYVALSQRDTQTGLRTLIARTNAGDIARLEAMVSRLAEVLRLQGDLDELQLRRAKAIAILADPATACLLLARSRQQHAEVREREVEDEPEHEVEDEPEDETTAYVSAVDAAGELGKLLLAQGATALVRLRPRSVLYVHISEESLRARAGVLRAEGIGPIGLSELPELLGRDAVVVQPVIAPREETPVDAYEVPRTMREALTLSQPFEAFPWGTLPARAAELDHTIPYRPPDHGGPPKQTRVDNLGPLSRGHHNAKTHAGFRLHQPTPGTYLWRIPSGYWYQVDRTGTHALGRAPLQPSSGSGPAGSPLRRHASLH
jgi:hypothetical protein